MYIDQFPQLGLLFKIQWPDYIGNFNKQTIFYHNF